MNLPPPTHLVIAKNIQTRVVHAFQAFTLAYAEALRDAYQDQGWTVEIRELRRATR